ncbi:SixA phosphatase family protein [Neomicrococcus aestuarii]|uniref:Histidine phosphatase n=1 Tax=Neomicrococcus aestuarii TaxID=556325 RepID=A0A1L2ZMR8_9MICC|nr:histidine phosphatase family protein [Neomicrococcus aestuarii]APF40693.1 histidine phosphatase [Neomicrococcus aestuarii]
MSSSPERRLVILRHAKSDYPLGVGDHDRPLAGRGNREAPAAGRWLVENGFVPDYLLVSSALRTRSTCAWVTSELGDQAPTPYIDDRLYEAGATEMLSIINETPDTVRTLMVIGHMPTVQDLSMRLASVESDEESVMEMATRYPTLGLTAFEINKPWAELDGRDAKLVSFVVPR